MSLLIFQIIEDYYLLRERNDVRLNGNQRRAMFLVESKVEWFQQQIPRPRHLYSCDEKPNQTFPVPHFNDEHWKNNLQTYLYCGDVHMNVLPAWKSNYYGQGVAVSVVDDGIFSENPDLRPNIANGLSYSIIDDSPDATPSDAIFSHGTRCAGIVAAKANNRFCGVGVAPKAKIAGVKLFASAIQDLTDAEEALALSHGSNNVSIYSCSFGPSDYSNVLEGPDPLTFAAMKRSAEKGRGEKGSIYVFSAGNGGNYGDSCAYNGYINNIYTIGISAVLKNGSLASYDEACTSIFGVTYSRVYGEVNATLVVPYGPDSCNTKFSGTSAAAALGSGVIALTLSANQALTVRDVQHLIARTSNSNGICGKTWKTNAAGFRVSDYCGFGLLDAGKLTLLAATWRSVSEQVVCTLRQLEDSVIPQDGQLETNVTMSPQNCEKGTIQQLEHVLLTVNITFPHRGHLRIAITSPQNTTSVIVPGRPTDEEPDLAWTFMTIHHWGERAEGTWTLHIENTHPHLNNTGVLHDWEVVFHGTKESAIQDEETDSSIVPSVQERRRDLEELELVQFLRDEAEVNLEVEKATEDDEDEIDLLIRETKAGLSPGEGLKSYQKTSGF
ncbi:endoprotease bli-like [Branchiostoma lanceolatum]|uniref:endoprotease bli-like n=1 Tax=Branchiostoma lanceolatum TaxID=7740 RepID=UPI00345353AA